MDLGQTYDAADQALQEVNREAQERAEAFVRWALEHGGDKGDAHAVCYLAGLRWDDVKPH
jgi:hypothetical protein